MKLDDMQLPKINERKQRSKIMQNSLYLEVAKTIENFEKDNDYEFESYEVDNMLLNMIKRNHESYLRSKFGNDMV